MRSLFDRISEPQSTDFAGHQHIHDCEIRSVERELNCLLNTRSYISGKKPGVQRTILDYGMDDLVSAGTKVSSKLENVIANVRSAIENYEPRLTGVAVTGEYFRNNPTQVMVNVTARLRHTQEPIQYKIPLTIPTTEA